MKERPRGATSKRYRGSGSMRLRKSVLFQCHAERCAIVGNVAFVRSLCRVTVYSLCTLSWCNHPAQAHRTPGLIANDARWLAPNMLPMYIAISSALARAVRHLQTRRHVQALSLLERLDGSADGCRGSCWGGTAVMRHVCSDKMACGESTAKTQFAC